MRASRFFFALLTVALLVSFSTAAEDEPIDAFTGSWDDITDLSHVQSDTMDLIQESRLWTTGADLSLAAPSPLSVTQLLQEQRGAQTHPNDCAVLVPDRGKLCVADMTGGQIRDWLEACAADSTQPIDQLYGADYDIYLGNPEEQRVLNMAYQGMPLQEAQVFQVAVDRSLITSARWYAVTGIRADQVTDCDYTGPEALCEFIRVVGPVSPLRGSSWTLHQGIGDPAPQPTPITRREFVSLLYHNWGVPGILQELPFSDVSPDDTVIAWAYTRQIIFGNDQSQFLPEDPITREQAAAMLLRYAGLFPVAASDQGISVLELRDYFDISQWALSGVDFCYNTGVIPPIGTRAYTDLFAPQALINEQNAQAMISTLLALAGAE